MKKSKQTSRDWLNTLTLIGRILIFVPVIFGLIVFISPLFVQPEIIEGPYIEGPTTIAVIEYNAGYAILNVVVILIFLCGLATLVYVAIKRFRQGLHGDLEDEEK